VPPETALPVIDGVLAAFEDGRGLQLVRVTAGVGFELAEAGLLEERQDSFCEVFDFFGVAPELELDGVDAGGEQVLWSCFDDGFTAAESGSLGVPLDRPQRMAGGEVACAV